MFDGKAKTSVDVVGASPIMGNILLKVLLLNELVRVCEKHMDATDNSNDAAMIEEVMHGLLVEAHRAEQIMKSQAPSEAGCA